jgi:hypothetical protein
MPFKVSTMSPVGAPEAGAVPNSTELLRLIPFAKDNRYKPGLVESELDVGGVPSDAPYPPLEDTGNHYEML